MKIKALSTVALVAVGTLASVAPQAAHAGCGVNITLNNLDPVSATVDWSQSKVTQNAVVWNRLGTSTQGVAANGTISQTFNLFAGCNAQRRYKFKVTEGGNTRTIYYPSSAGWTTNVSPDVDIDF